MNGSCRRPEGTQRTALAARIHPPEPEDTGTILE